MKLKQNIGKSNRKQRSILNIISIIIIIFSIFSIINIFTVSARGQRGQDLDLDIIPGGSEYDGQYYLHDDLPEHGQDIGNTHDVGDLLRIQPHGSEERYCAKWVQFDFDEHVFGEVTGDESYTVLNIYYHIWWKSANEKAKLGVEVHGLYDTSTDFSFEATHENAVSTVEKNGYWLTTYYQQVSYIETDIHNMAIKIVSIDAIPSVYSAKDQYSFIIINVENNDILKTRDKDLDGLSDYEELYVYSTNPEDADTDDDGLNDAEEVRIGKDGHITDPNDFDMDIDDLVDGEDPDPNLTQYRIIGDEWVITGDEIVKNEGLMVENDITVAAGGKLTLENTVLKMNQNGGQHKIRVQAGGELHLYDNHLITDDPDHWYSQTLQTEHWHNECTIEVYGTAIIRNNIIDYGSMIYIRASNDTIIEGNDILHYYYGIFCSFSSPKVTGNIILPFIGNGIFLWHSSPEITDTIIKTYIGTGISCYYSSPMIRGCEIIGGSNDFFLSCDSHPIVSDTSFNHSMVHVDDEDSALLVGTFSSDIPKADEEDVVGDSGYFYLIMLAGISGLFILIIICAYYFQNKTWPLTDFIIRSNTTEQEPNNGGKRSIRVNKRRGKNRRNSRNGRNGKYGKNSKKRGYGRKNRK